MKKEGRWLKKDGMRQRTDNGDGRTGRAKTRKLRGNRRNEYAKEQEETSSQGHNHGSAR